MPVIYQIMLVSAVGLIGFLLGRNKAHKIEMTGARLKSRPVYHGWWCFLLGFLLLFYGKLF